MRRLIDLVRNGVDKFVYLLRAEGLGVALRWALARGIPLLIGVPLIRYSHITPEIYVGPQFGRAGKRRLAALGINSSVNLRDEFDDAAHGLALPNYCYLPTVNDRAPTLAQLEQGAAFIQQVLGERGKVYIHCEGGTGRAPTMAAAYFIRQGLSPDEAIALIKKSRPFIMMKPEQIERLRQFAAARPDRQGPASHSVSLPPKGRDRRACGG